MQLAGREILNSFKLKHEDSRTQLDAWDSEASNSIWQTPTDIKRRYVGASILRNNHVIFNIKGNKYRLLTLVNYRNGIVLIKKIGTHDEYMKWKIN